MNQIKFWAAWKIAVPIITAAVLTGWFGVSGATDLFGSGISLGIVLAIMNLVLLFGIRKNYA